MQGHFPDAQKDPMRYDVPMIMRFLQNMSIRARVGAALVIVMAGYTVIHQVVDRVTISRAMLHYEKEQARRDLLRCQRALEREIRHILVVTADWAAWDDTYAFIETHDPRYIASNLVVETFYDSGINLICFFDRDGGLVWGEAHDLEQEQQLDLAPFMVFPRTLEVDDDSPPGSLAGIMLVGEVAMLVACHPILTSENTGPSRGTVVMGRLLTPAVLTALQHQTQVEFCLRPIRNDDKRDAQLLAEIQAGGGTALDSSDTDTLHVSGRLTDFFGVPALLLEAHIPRAASLEGRRIIQFGMLSTIVSSLLFLLALMIALRYTVLAPMSRLTRAVVRISETGDVSERLACNRGDEVGQLAREFNSLLDTIESNVRQQAEAAEVLRENAAHLRAIMQAARDAVFTVTPSSTIESANPAAQAIFGWPVEQLINRPADALLNTTGTVRGGMAAILEKASELPEGFRNEVIGIRRDGTTFPAYLMVKDYAVESGTMYVLFVADLTEIKNMHERLLRDRHLASIGEMGASIAHEIRNPLTGISSALQVLRKNTNYDEDERTIFEDILVQIKRVDRTVSNLLTFAKSWRLDCQWCNVKRMLTRAWEEVECQNAPSNVVFALEIDDHVEAIADPGLCHQVFCNVLQNATQSMPGGGQIRVSASSDTRHVRVTVADDGIGMEPEVLKKATSPFFTTRVKGTGLGLAICQRIVEAHGGSICIDSVPKTGTEVVITLPVEDTHAEAHPGG